MCLIWQINSEYQFDERMFGQCCFISLDGTNIHIQEPSPFDPMWYSHTFKEPGGGMRWGYACEQGGLFGGAVHFLVECIQT